MTPITRGVVVLAAVGLLAWTAAVGPAAANDFYAFDPAFTGGTDPADCGGPNAFGNHWIVVASGAGMPPTVRAYVRGTDNLIYGPIFEWNPLGNSFAGGIRVSCAVDGRNGWTGIIVSAGPGGGPHVTQWWLP